VSYLGNSLISKRAPCSQKDPIVRHRNVDWFVLNLVWRRHKTCWVTCLTNKPSSNLTRSRNPATLASRPVYMQNCRTKFKENWHLGLKLIITVQWATRVITPLPSISYGSSRLTGGRSSQNSLFSLSFPYRYPFSPVQKVPERHNTLQKQPGILVIAVYTVKLIKFVHIESVLYNFWAEKCDVKTRKKNSNEWDQTLSDFDV